MKTKILLLIIIGITAFFPSRSFAQEQMELSLDGAINFAVENNRLIKNASLSIKESQAALRATIAQGLPQADATLDYQNFFNAQAYLGPMTFVFNPTSNLNLSVSQLIFSGSYFVGIKMQKLYQEMNEISYQKTDADIRTQVMTSYYLVLVSQRTLEILEQNVVNMNDVIQKTEALVLMGILDETDFDQISLQKTNLENAVRSARRQIELAMNLLRLQLGVSAETEIVLTNQLFTLLATLDPETTAQKSYDLNQNLDFQLMMIQRDMAKQKMNLEKTKFLPTVAGFYNHTEKIKKAELDFAPKNVIGINVTIPIFSSGVRTFTHAQAKIQYQMAQNQMDQVSEQLSIQEKQLRQNLSTAIEQYQVQKETIELARRVYDNIYRKYQQGVISGLDLTTASSNLLQAENGYLMSIMQLIDAKVNLDKFLNQLTQNN